MKPILTAIVEIWGLFVEDGTLAISILVWFAVAAWLFPKLSLRPILEAPLFFAGLCALLLENVYRSARKQDKS